MSKVMMGNIICFLVHGSAGIIPCIFDAWVLHSKIAYAVSDSPDRDFQIQKIVLQGRALDGDSIAWDAQMVSNPHLKKFNGKYYLYYIGLLILGSSPQDRKVKKSINETGFSKIKKSE